MKTILVATDFSAAANNAVLYAAQLAQQFKSKLIVLNVFSSFVPVTAYDAIPPIDSFQEAGKTSAIGLEETKKRIEQLVSNLEIEMHSISGSPQLAIENLTNDCKADLIVMGITGSAGKIKERIIGSTTLDIARDMKTPLIIVPEEATYQLVQKMTFACDIYNLHGSSVLENVKLFCKLFNARLEIVNIEKPSVEDKPIRIRNYNFMESVLEDLKHETIILVEDDSQEVLQNHLANHQPEMLVLNPQKHNFLQSLFHKSFTKSMVFHVKTPLLIVH